MIKPKAKAVADLSGFRRSRIYAEGWNAARGGARAETNPYTREAERARWLEGYNKRLS